MNLEPGETQVIQLRLCQLNSTFTEQPFGRWFDQIFKQRLVEADKFYQTVIPQVLNEDQAKIMRLAIAGMLWSKQYYHFNLDIWLDEHDANPLLGGKRQVRNRDW